MNKTHDMSYSSEYSAWKHAKLRCINPKDRNFKNYGGRGIKMYFGRLENFQAFIDHIGRKPSKKHWLERINNEKGYEPGNVCWSTPSENLLNRRKPRLIENFSNKELLKECKHRGLL